MSVRLETNSDSHPFDTIKVRLQTSPDTQFRGPLDCVLQTLRKEGVNGIYKGGELPSRLPDYGIDLT